jgi:NADPH:quinone reductase-like Zn-dependent oxidoreductase
MAELLYAFNPDGTWQKRSKRMKAIVIEHRGESGALVDIPIPSPAAHEILVRVTAAGVNPVDWKRLDRTDETFPFVLGQDFAGVVSRPGDRVTKYREGERIFGIADEHGTYAEYTIVSEDGSEGPVAKIPDGIGDADAAALPTAGLTALASLDTLGVEKGTTLLILGASGGVGGFAVQIARSRGAHVIGTGSSTSEAFARSLGVDEFIAYDRQNVVETVKATHPNGVDAVLDLVDDPDAIKETAGVLRDGGAIVSTIRSADINWFAQRNIRAVNIGVPQTPEFSHAGLRTLLRLLEQGAINVVIAAERPLAEATAALDESKSGTVNGKIVITVD